ncbi:unnamed protein product [Effrenium voratum]|nr:unnamed protein product [Effrenium voratum]CAJ1429059.1 unnamed protein product [Effrenium voratum]
MGHARAFGIKLARLPRSFPRQSFQMPPKRDTCAKPQPKGKAKAKAKAKTAPKPAPKPAAKSNAKGQPPARGKSQQREVGMAPSRAVDAEDTWHEKNIRVGMGRFCLLVSQVLREAFIQREAQLESALQKAQHLESRAEAERRKAEEAQKRAAVAEACVKELRERAARAEALQLEVAQAQARAAHAEAKAEVLSEIQENFQRNIPEMVRSIASTVLECTGRRGHKRLAGTPGFRGVRTKLEIEDSCEPPAPDDLPLVATEREDHPDKAAEELMKFYGQAGTEEIPSSAEASRSDAPENSRSKASRITYGVADALKRAVRR